MAAGTQGGRRVAEDAAVVGDTIGPQGSAGAIAGEAAGDISELASGLKDAAREQGRALLDAARGQAQSYADSRKDTAAQAIADVAASIREGGKGFSDRPNINAFASTAADGLDQLAAGLRDRSFAEIYGDIEDYARRQPVAVAAACVVGGFILARFIKSSAEDLSEQSSALRAEAGVRGVRRPASRRA